VRKPVRKITHAAPVGIMAEHSITPHPSHIVVDPNYVEETSRPTKRAVRSALEQVQDPAYRKRREKLGYVYFTLTEADGTVLWHESKGGRYAKMLGLDHVIDDEEAAAIAADLAKYGLTDD